MEQVPVIGIVGSGRLATHLRHYFNLLNISTISVSARNGNFSTLQQCQIIFILTVDSAIAEVARKLEAFNAQLIHCSGTKYFMHIVGIHPLMTFTNSLYSLEQYQKIRWIIDQQNFVGRKFLEKQWGEFKFIRAEQKPLYHALCVAGGNFTTLLWQEVFFQARQLGLGKEDFAPYLEQTVKNLLQAENSLTGPLVRKDQQTIEANLSALAGSELATIYKNFNQLYQEQQGRDDESIYH